MSYSTITRLVRSFRRRKKEIITSVDSIAEAGLSIDIDGLIDYQLATESRGPMSLASGYIDAKRHWTAELLFDSESMERCYRMMLCICIFLGFLNVGLLASVLGALILWYRIGTKTTNRILKVFILGGLTLVFFSPLILDANVLVLYILVSPFLIVIYSCRLFFTEPFLYLLWSSSASHDEVEAKFRHLGV